MSDKKEIISASPKVRKLAREFGIITNIGLVYCDLNKSCAVVKATAQYQGEKIEPGILLPKTSKIDLVLGNGKR